MLFTPKMIRTSYDDFVRNSFVHSKRIPSNPHFIPHSYYQFKYHTVLSNIQSLIYYQTVS